jgi:hypothetical protein
MNAETLKYWTECCEEQQGGNGTVTVGQKHLTEILSIFDERNRLARDVERLTRQLESAKYELAESKEWRQHGADLSKQVSELKQKLVTKNIIRQQLSNLKKDYDELKQDHFGALERRIQANRKCLRLEAEVNRLEAESAAMREAIKKQDCAACYGNCKGLIGSDKCVFYPVMNGTAGADLLARHAAEVAVYRDALDEIREVAEGYYDRSGTGSALGNVGLLADQALNDRWSAGEWMARVHKLEAAVEAATRLCKIKAANEFPMGDAWTHLEIALAKLDGGGK